MPKALLTTSKQRCACRSATHWPGRRSTMAAFAERLKEYHRSLKPKRAEEPSMKQVAYSFGGLYMVIHLLQYFDIWTLLIFAVVGYVIWSNIVQIMSSTGEETPSAATRTQSGSSRASKPPKMGKKKNGG